MVISGTLRTAVLIWMLEIKRCASVRRPGERGVSPVRRKLCQQPLRRRHVCGLHCCGAGSQMSPAPAACHTTHPPPYPPPPLGHPTTCKQPNTGGSGTSSPQCCHLFGLQIVLQTTPPPHLFIYLTQFIWVTASNVSTRVPRETDRKKKKKEREMLSRATGCVIFPWLCQEVTL